MPDDQHQRESERIKEFGAFLEPVADAMNAGRFVEVPSLMWAAFQYVAENPFESNADVDKFEAEADQAEKRGDWQTVERLYRAQILLESRKGNEPRGPHGRLARLLQFLGRDVEALEHGRRSYELCRNHEVEMVRVMGAVVFAKLKAAETIPGEVETALCSSLATLPNGHIYVHLRAKALVEIGNVRRLLCDPSRANELVDEAFEVLASQSSLYELPGYQATIARAWQVRAAAQSASGNEGAFVNSWKAAVEWQGCAALWFEDESPIDADHHSRFLKSAAEGLLAAGDRDFAFGLLHECDRIRGVWGLSDL